MLTFSHSGKIGDLLYSLQYCLDRTAASGETGFTFDIRTNRSPTDINADWDDPAVLLSDKDAAFIKPLLEAQPYIDRVTVNGEIGIDLDQFRCCKLNLISGDLRDYYYQIDGNMYPREF
jgi:hypothetical protein